MLDALADFIRSQNDNPYFHGAVTGLGVMAGMWLASTDRVQNWRYRRYVWPAFVATVLGTLVLLVIFG